MCFSLTGIKGVDFLDDVWELAEEVHECVEDHFAQEAYGEIECTRCKKVIITQNQVDSLEARGLIGVKKGPFYGKGKNSMTNRDKELVIEFINKDLEKGSTKYTTALLKLEAELKK